MSKDPQKRLIRERKYREKNRDKLNALARASYERNKKIRAEKQRERREANRDKYREYDNDWYEKNKKKKLEWTRRRRESLRTFLADLKSTLKCNRCPENHPGCLVFHHKDPDTKEANLSTIIYSWSLKRIQEEIAKCEVLCANCHSKHHWQERQEKGDLYESEQSKSNYLSKLEFALITK